MSGTRYLERPAPGVPEIACTWTQAVTPQGEAHVQRVVPDGCIDVIWSSRHGELHVAGPDTSAFLARLEPGEQLVGVRFRPGAAPPALGVPAAAVLNQRAPLGELWGSSETATLAETLAASADPQKALLQAVVRRIRAGGPPDPAANALVKELLVARDGLPAVADALGLSDRQLRRRALDAFGYPPKTLHRVLRFQQAISLARHGTPFAEIAYRAGYSDQAHLANEVRHLAGVPLSALIP